MTIEEAFAKGDNNKIVLVGQGHIKKLDQMFNPKTRRSKRAGNAKQRRRKLRFMDACWADLLTKGWK